MLFWYNYTGYQPSLFSQTPLHELQREAVGIEQCIKSADHHATQHNQVQPIVIYYNSHRCIIYIHS